jgi:hypothetical protein
MLRKRMLSGLCHVYHKRCKYCDEVFECNTRFRKVCDVCARKHYAEKNVKVKKVGV